MSREGASIADRILEIPITCLILAINAGVFLIAWTQGVHGVEFIGADFAGSRTFQARPTRARPRMTQ